MGYKHLYERLQPLILFCFFNFPNQTGHLCLGRDRERGGQNERAAPPII